MSLPHSSSKSMSQYYERGEAERANPDSRYWLYESKATQATLEGLIGADAYEAWAELVWPGDSIDNKTWKEINEATNRALVQAMQGVRGINALVDAAKYDLYNDGNIPAAYGL